MRGFIAGAWRELARGQFYSGGQWKRLTRVLVYIGGSWRTAAQFVQPLSVSAFDVYGYNNTFKPIGAQVTSSLATATPSGGLAPYSYVWTRLSGGASITNPTQAGTYFTDFVAANSESFSTMRCVCTDSIGNTASVTISVTLTNESS